MEFMKTTICILLLFFSSTLNADLSVYFKKAENKSDIHKMRNIDFIYLINLDKRPVKLQHTLMELQPYGIYPYRFSAVNGYSLSLDEINDMGVKLAPGMKTGEIGIYYSLGNGGYPEPKHEIMNNYGKTYFNVNHGGLGCVLSHLSILQDAYDSNYETIWMIEDDIAVLKDPRLIPDLIEELDHLVGKNNWDILFTDNDRRNNDGTYMTCGCAPSPGRPNYTPKGRNFALVRPVGKHFKQIGSRFGTHSMIVRRSGMKKILDFIKSRGIFLNIDQEVFLTEGIQLYATTEDIVSNAFDTISDAESSWDLLNAER